MTYYWSKTWATDHETEYYALLALQDYGCGICKAKDKPLVVDHDHRTKRIRGLLCYKCNSWLQLLDRYPHEFIEATLSYIVHPPIGWLGE